MFGTRRNARVNRTTSVIRGVFSAAALAVLLLPAGAGAQSDEPGFRGWGPRVGFTIDPDQFHFGTHFDFGNFADHVRFQPNLELGLSDDLTLFALNLEAAYRFSSAWDVWTPYAGGGFGVNFYDPEGGDSDTEFGVNMLGGIERGLSSGNRFFLEVKFGLVDSPDVKFTTGWTFF